MVKFKELHLKELYDELVMGQSPSSETYNDEKKGLPFVQGNADMKDGVPKIRIYSTDPKKLSQKGDLLLSVRAPVGDLFKNNIGEIAIGRGLSAIRINDQYLNKYVHHYFSWDKRQFLKLEQGTTFTEIGKREVRNLKILLPENPNEQTAIASLLSKVDEAIEATQNSIKEAEKLKKALMQNLLTGKLKPDGTWRTEDEFYETKIGLLPMDWKLLKTKDFCEKVTDGTHDTPKPNSSGFPLVTSKNLKSNGVDFDDCYLIREQDYNEINKRSKVSQYDILFGMIGTVGNPQIVTQNPVEFAIKNVGLFRMNGNKKLSFWLKYFLDSDLFRIYKQRQQAGTTQQFVSLGFLRKIPVPLPMKNDEINYFLIDEINEKIMIADNELDSKQTKIQTLQRLKKSLMQNLLTGKVRLPTDFIAQFESTVEVNHKIEIA
jgi:type I restriction enzyme S subunit